MNLREMLQERKDLKVQLTYLYRLQKHVDPLSKVFDWSGENFFRFKSFPVFYDIRSIMLQAVFDSIDIAEKRLREIDENLAAIYAILNGGVDE
jgi:hypothetical protein